MKNFRIQTVANYGDMDKADLAAQIDEDAAREAGATKQFGQIGIRNYAYGPKRQATSGKSTAGRNERAKLGRLFGK